MNFKTFFIPIFACAALFVTSVVVQVIFGLSGHGVVYWIVALPIGLLEVWFFVRWWLRSHS